MAEPILKPCPFCGSADGREPEHYGVKIWQERRSHGDRQTDKGNWVAECMNCGVYLNDCSSAENAVDSWNERHAPPQEASHAE